ncbi:2'-5' RNA ligase family protein [Schumannella sp. 10F1B-5-1]|uniref:2'-5' RNA ligase family protein n=1 Tax=Schumannella sp. 10F1B-5-1 TaxID=2590780 RepID=UPI0011327A56|nr:2'-5' RNA ligase family protein [Schumannella sp. 10F1B-5-1]TPW72843.1 2'-5' RNA ligase family protein [Schumannella sp. 10F1B-5-1]
MRFLIAAFLEDAALDTEFAPGTLPLHVTLLSPAETDADQGQLEAAIESALAAFGPIETEAGDDELFGGADSIEVTLLDDDEGELDAVHRALIQQLRPLGVRLLDPQHAGAGYRPHVSVTDDGDRVDRGERVELDAVALLERDAHAEGGPVWRLVAQFPLI